MSEMVINSFIEGMQMLFRTTSPSESITLPLKQNHQDTSDPLVYNFAVDWGDGNVDAVIAWDDSNKVHQYSVAGDYVVSITGVCESLYFNNDSTSNKLIEIRYWGDVGFKDLYRAFYGCINVDVTATDTPNLEYVLSLRQMFMDCGSLVGNSSFNNWSVGHIESLYGMFQALFVSMIFTQDLDNWDVSNNVTLYQTFSGFSGLSTNAFNGNITTWVTSSLESMGRMAEENTAFDQDLGSWDITLCSAMNLAFKNSGLSTANYDQILIGWAAQTPVASVNVDFSPTQYTIAVSGAARAVLTGAPNNWTITDGGGI